jgi:PAS domain S-box-containing protein
MKPSDTTETEKKYRMIFDNANDGIIIHDLEGNIFDVNRSMYNRLGYTKEEMMSMNLSDLVSPRYAERIKERTKGLEQAGVAIFKSEDRRKDGTFMPVEVSARIVEHNGKMAIQSVVRDISDRKIAEDLIEMTMRTNDILSHELRESAHISALINRFLFDALDRSSSESQERIIQTFQDRQAVFMHILEKISHSPNIMKIDFMEIMRSLLVFLESQKDIEMKNKQIRLRIENTFMDITRTLRCGLILNELIMNSLSHAFPERSHGLVEVMTSQDNSSTISLCVKDDGIGLPEDIDIHQAKTTGFQLLMEWVKQIKGQIRYHSHDGTEFLITLSNR